MVRLVLPLAWLPVVYLSVVEYYFTFVLMAKDFPVKDGGQQIEGAALAQVRGKLFEDLFAVLGPMP